MQLEFPYQKFPPKNFSEKIRRIFWKIFGHPINFFLGHHRPTNLGAAGEASSAAGEPPAPAPLLA